MTQKMGVDHALGKIEAQAGRENVFELFPDEFRVGFIVFHGLGSKDKVESSQQRKERRLNTESTEARARRSRRPQGPRKERILNSPTGPGQAPNTEAEAQRRTKK